MAAIRFLTVAVRMTLGARSCLPAAAVLFAFTLLPASARAAEHLVNGDFKAGALGWENWIVTGQAVRSFQSTRAPNGGEPPCFEMASSTGAGGIFQPLDLEPGREYLVSARSRNVAMRPESAAQILIGTEKPQDGEDYFDNGAAQKPPGTIHLFGWDDACPEWNGNQHTACSGPMRLRFRATAPIMYLVVRCAGPNGYDISFDDISVLDAEPCPRPVIKPDPADQFACIGETATFSIQASGGLPLFYRWRRNGEYLEDGPRFNGAHTPKLTVLNADGTIIGRYDCVVSSPCGETVSQPARLSVPILYVDIDAGGKNDGSSWADALTDLQAAMFFAQDNNCRGAEVWVANGTYRPSFNPNPADPRGFSFVLRDRVRVYGGFEGASDPNQHPEGEIDRTQRDPRDPKRAVMITNTGIPSRYVVTSQGNAPTAVLDGVIIFTAPDAPTGCSAEFNFLNTLATIENNEIRTTATRYLDLAPEPHGQLEPIVQDNRFHLIDDPGTTAPHGTLLELRQRDFDCPPNQGECPPGAFAAPTGSPGFAHPWAIEELEVRPGGRITLTDRKGMHFEDGPESDREVAYVRRLILRDNAVLNTAGHRVYYLEKLEAPTARIINVPLQGLSLNRWGLNEPSVLDCTVRIDPETPQGAVEIIPNERGPGDGVMRMRLADNAPVAVKGRFARVGEDFITVAFEYRFFGAPTRLIVSLSDEETPGGGNFPIARIRPPGAGRPGAPGSPRFGLFFGRFPRPQLNLSRGAYIRLDLVDDKTATGAAPPAKMGEKNADLPPDVQPFDGDAGVDIDNWGARIVCSYGCADLSGDGVPDDRDYLLVLSLYGRNTGDVDLETGDCSDSIFGGDQYVDLADLLTWDLILDPSGTLPTACDLLGGSPFALSGLETGLAGAPDAPAPDTHPAGAPGGPSANLTAPDTLIVAGKSNANEFQEDAIYTFDMSGACLGGSAGTPAGGDASRSNGRLVRGHGPDIFQIHGVSYGGSIEQQGLIRLSDSANVLPPRMGLAGPEGMSPVTVAVGLNTVGGSIVGLPLADAAFHPTQDDIVYVLPVLVTPTDGSCPYKAAARVHLLPGNEPPYEIETLYGLNPAPTSSITAGDCASTIVYEPDTQQPRELELDASEHLFVANAQGVGENDFLLVYDGSANLTGEQAPLVTYAIDGIVDAPMGLELASTGDHAYLASSVNALPGAKTRVYRFAVQRTGGVVTGFSPAGSIEIGNPPDGDLGYGLVASVTGIQAAGDGSLYVLGMTVPKVPADLSTSDPLYALLFGPYPFSLEPVFSTPTLGVVPPSFSGVVNAVALSCHNLALPVSALIADVTSPTLESALSRKTHGPAGDFDIDLSLANPPASECRAGGPMRLVLTFSEPIVADDGTLDGNEVALSAGSLAGAAIAGPTLTLSLTGVPDQTCLTLSLANLSDLAGNPLPSPTSLSLRILEGDADNIGLVTAGDTDLSKSHSSQAVSTPNLRCDINLDGEVDCADIIRIKARLGHAAACP